MADGVQRILLLDGELSFRGSSLMTLRLARGLEKREVDTALVCTGLGPLDTTLLQGIRLHQIPGLAVPLWGKVVLRTLFRDMKKQPPDVIHLHDPRLMSQARWLSEQLQSPLVISVSDHAEAAGLRLDQAPKSLKAIISVSESVQSQIPEQAKLREIEQRVILPGVTVSEHCGAGPLSDPKREPVVGMAGPLEIIKGASFFLRACHRVVEAGHDIRIVIAGSGPEERSLRQLANSLELLPRLTFVDGGVSMKAYLSAMDIFCLPSLQQGLGVMMLEAMSLGRPVIASGVGGVLCVIEDNKTGLIVPPSDSRSLADRMLELLNNPEKTKAIACAGRELVRSQFNETRMLDEYLQLYQEIRDRQKRQPAVVPMARTGRGPETHKP
ncbi:MAG: glycosyltransferase family 4 protein [Planctomyces sp.]|nr:glycosyltransferase family 4 protein [Planctomyces sp.]